MKNVTPNRVLPDWAIEELGFIAEENGWKIVVKPMAVIDQVIIKILGKNERLGSNGLFSCMVTMTSDWEDLAHLRSGDLTEVIESRAEEHNA